MNTSQIQCAAFIRKSWCPKYSQPNPVCVHTKAAVCEIPMILRLLRLFASHDDEAQRSTQNKKLMNPPLNAHQHHSHKCTFTELLIVRTLQNATTGTGCAGCTQLWFHSCTKMGTWVATKARLSTCPSVASSAAARDQYLRPTTEPQ